MYSFLNGFFFVFHTVFILFVLLAWLWRPLRPAHLAAVTATLFSWFVLGLWYGFGFCPCTDWHWRVRVAMGLYDMPRSYTKFLFDRLTGLNANETLVDVVTVAALIFVSAASLYLNYRDRHRGNAKQA